MNFLFVTACLTRSDTGVQAVVLALSLQDGRALATNRGIGLAPLRVDGPRDNHHD